MSAAGSTTILTLLAVISLQGLLPLAAPTSENAHITPDLRLDESAPVSRTVALKRQRRYRDDYWQGPSRGHSSEDSDETDWGHGDVNEDSHRYFRGHSGRRSHEYFGGNSRGRSRPPFFGLGFGIWRRHSRPPYPPGFGYGPNGGRYNTNNDPDFQPMPETPPSTTTRAPVTRRTKATKGPKGTPTTKAATTATAVTTTTTSTTTTTTEEPLLIDLRSGVA